MWRLPWTSDTHIQESWRFKSMYTLQGTSDQHATHFPCLVRIWPSNIRISHGPHIATFHEVVNSDGQSHYSQEKGLRTKSTAQWPIDPWVHTQFLSWASHWTNWGKVTLYWCQATRLTGPIYQHAISTFNTFSWGLTHWSLTNTGRGYSLGGAGFPHITTQPSQLTDSTFHLKSPLDLRLSIQQLPIELDVEQTLNLASGSLHSTSTISYHLN
jgi:hypothetical protein